MTAIQNFIQWATAQDELLMNGTRMVIVEKAEEFAKLEQRENGAVEHILKQIKECYFKTTEECKDLEIDVLYSSYQRIIEDERKKFSSDSDVRESLVLATALGIYYLLELDKERQQDAG